MVDVKTLDYKGFFVLVPETSDHPVFGVSLDRYFCGENWDCAKSLVAKSGGFVLPLVYGVEFYRLLRSDSDLFCADGSRMSSHHRKLVVDDIFGVVPPYRGEWFDNVFSKDGGDMVVRYGKFGSDGILSEVTEPLDDCLSKNKTPGIDLDYWLKNPTRQGLPAKNTTDGSFYYWYPRDGDVGRFGADSGRAWLGCNGSSQVSDSGLGVRVAKIFK